MTNPYRELAHDLTCHAKDRLVFFRKLALAEQAPVFEILSPYVRQNLLRHLRDEEIVNLLDEMDLRQADNTLTLLKNPKRRNKIISRLKSELKEKSDYFLRFHPKATIGLLNFNYLLFSGATPVVEVAKAIQGHYQEVGKLPEILVQEGGKLAGEVPLLTIIGERQVGSLKKHLQPIKTVSYQAAIKEIIEAFSEAKHGKVVVLDQDGSVIGLIYSDEALALFEKDPTTMLYNFAGVSETERAFDSVKSKVRHRYKWLIINLGTAFLAATVVSLFKDTIDALVILAIYMPVVAGMGGNAATQTLAMIVRGITVGEISLKNSAPVLLREALAGLANGAINGVIVALVAFWWNGSAMLGLVVALAMVINLVVAGFFGAFVPLLMKALGKDPATSATIFITTATDVFGLLAFLGLASWLLL